MRRLTAKQEKFAQLVASGSTQSAAYKEAYDVNQGSKPTTAYQEGHTLAETPKIALRIQEIQQISEATATNEIAWSKVDLVREAKLNLDLARTGGYKGIGSANGALELIGRVTGLLSEKQQAATVTVTRITVVTTDSVTELEEANSVAFDTEIEATWLDAEGRLALNVPKNED